MDDSKKYINLDDNSSIPKKSAIFYNNLNTNNDENIVNNLNLVPSILDDQFGKLKNRNHYLKNTFVNYYFIKSVSLYRIVYNKGYSLLFTIYLEEFICVLVHILIKIFVIALRFTVYK